jgi:hypothetical protein
MLEPPEPDEPEVGRGEVIFAVAVLVLVLALVAVFVLAMWRMT